MHAYKKKYTHKGDSRGKRRRAAVLPRRLRSVTVSKSGSVKRAGYSGSVALAGLDSPGTGRSVYSAYLPGAMCWLRGDRVRFRNNFSRAL